VIFGALQGVFIALIASFLWSSKIKKYYL